MLLVYSQAHVVEFRDGFAGEVIICQEPYASTPNKISVGSSCDHCFTPGNLRKCSVCRVAWYCGSVCQVLTLSFGCFMPLMDKHILLWPCVNILCGDCYAFRDLTSFTEILCTESRMEAAST